MKRDLEVKVATAVKALFDVDMTIDLSRPEEQFGDYSTNVALQLAKHVGQNPRQVGEQLAEKLRTDLAEQVSEISIAGPGFINLKLTDVALIAVAQAEPAKTLTGQEVVAEYSDPNPFKMLHVGHIYTTVVGDAIANLQELAGGTVHRVNYGGDVGLHVGRTMWAILQRLGGEHPEKLAEIPENERPAWLSSAYVEGNNAYGTNEESKAEIIALNKQMYQLHSDDDHDSPLAQIYWTCRKWSYEAFDVFYARLGAKLEKYYPESEVAEEGLRLVREHVGTVFEESEGAVIFRGEDYDLHTRVFINQQGIPTYEAKEMGLLVKKDEDYHFDRSVVITANEQQQYMAVVLKAAEQFLPELVKKTVYVPHGMVKLEGGVKMSSRLGNIIPATAVLDITNDAIRESGRTPEDATMLGAIKYSFLKTRLGGDIIYDPKESVSLEGNSGPYLQYAHARARSILAKSTGSYSVEGNAPVHKMDLEVGERSLMRKISEYAEVIDRATVELMPHHICTYLYELAQTFNRFYEHNRVIGDERQSLRLQLVEQYADKLRDGLSLLGITAPDKL